MALNKVGLVALVVAALGLSGCGVVSGLPVPPGFPVPAPARSSAPVSAPAPAPTSAPPTTDAPAPTETVATPAPTTTVTVTVPAAPPASVPAPAAPPASKGKVLRTVGWGSAFASPTGRILCLMVDGMAECEFPEGMNRTGIPDERSQCRGGGSIVRVTISREGVEFPCATDAPAIPEPGSAETAWARGQNVGTTKLPWGAPGVQLPYGWTLTGGGVECSSAEDGVSCWYLASGKGFRVARAGVTRLNR